MIKCQKCAKAAIVHLTEVVHGGEVGQEGLGKRVMEIHVCLQHAIELGLAVAPAVNMDTAAKVAVKPESRKESGSAGSGAIVPASAEGTGLAAPRERTRAGELTCPECGMTWGQFKQAGLMGCSHDYEQFQMKLLPLLKRAQEGATEHTGKVPARWKSVEGDRQVVTLRLRRELQKALHAEHYEQAAQLRDQLRELEN